MTTKLLETLTLAEEVIAWQVDGYVWEVPKAEEALAAIREQKAELEKQEPVAWALSHSFGLEFSSKYPMQETKEAAEQMARQHMGAVVVTPLYAAPVRTKDLTDDEIDAFIDRAWDKQMSMPEIIRAVIAADREKNK